MKEITEFTAEIRKLLNALPEGAWSVDGRTTDHLSLYIGGHPLLSSGNAKRFVPEEKIALLTYLAAAANPTTMLALLDLIDRMAEELEWLDQFTKKRLADLQKRGESYSWLKLRP